MALDKETKAASPGISSRGYSKRPSEQSQTPMQSTTSVPKTKSRDGSTAKPSTKKTNTLTKPVRNKAGTRKIGPIHNFFDKQKGSAASATISNKFSSSLRNDRRKAATSGKLIQKRVVTVARDAAGNIDFYPRKDSSEEGVDDASPMSPP